MTLRHKHDPWINQGAITWHNDPNFEAVVYDLIDQVRPSCFVETGTHMGWTSHWVAERFPWLPLYTCESHPRYQVLCAENLDDFPQARAWKGDSLVFLDKMMDFFENLTRGHRNAGPPMFWLDAHWWPPVPLREECGRVAKLRSYVCMLDDFYLRDPDFEGDTFFDSNGENGIKNDIAYVGDILGTAHLRPNYQAQPGFKGYGVFLRGIDYGHDLLKPET